MKNLLNLIRGLKFDSATEKGLIDYYNELTPEEKNDVYGEMAKDMIEHVLNKSIKFIAAKNNLTENAVIDLVFASIEKNKNRFSKKIFKEMLPKKEVKKDYQYYLHHQIKVDYLYSPNSPIINYLHRDKINMFKVAEFDIYRADWDFVIEQKNASGKVVESLKMSEASPD